MLDSTPTANQLWEGIGGHFENLGEVLCEFIDNSISNLINSQSSNRTIYISVESEKEKYRISIEDGVFCNTNVHNNATKSTELCQLGFSVSTTHA